MSKQLSKASPRRLPKRKRRTSEQIADRIVEAAGEVFERCGYANATTAAIAQRAEVTEAQVFRLFRSKQDLFRAAIFKPLNRHFSEFHARNTAELAQARSVRAMARRYIDELQDFMEQHSGMVMSLIVASAYTPDATEGVSELKDLRAYFDRGAAMMASRVGKGARVDPRLLVRVSFAAVLANVMFRQWLFPEGMASDRAIRAAIADFVIDGINVNDRRS